LASTLLTYQHRTRLPTDVRSREQFAIPADRHWYVCAQQLGKFHVDFDPVLGGILRGDANGIIVVTGDRFGHHADQLRQRFAAVLPDVAQRIHFLPRLDQLEYLSLLHHADVLLDPLHFGGVNSTYDGLSFGKPIVTLPSPYHRGRYTLGCYRKMDFLDCVAASPSEYVDLAVRLGTDRDYRQHVGTRLMAASDVLFEDPGAVSEHERLFFELICKRLEERVGYESMAE
jgi:predicted O-linked N-acetylglucosamine transferase (SPINDLY family)